MPSRTLPEPPRPPDRRREAARPRRYRIDGGVALERRVLPALLAPLPGAAVGPVRGGSTPSPSMVVSAGAAAAAPGAQNLGLLSAAELSSGVVLDRLGKAMPADTGESYRFQVTGTGYYDLGINGSAVMPASPLSVQDSRGRVLTAEDLGDNAIGVTLAPGTYMLRVGSWPAGFSSQLDYQITMSAEADPDAPGRSAGGKDEAPGSALGGDGSASAVGGVAAPGASTQGPAAAALTAASATALALGHASGDLVALGVGPVGVASAAGPAGPAVTQLNLSPAASTPGQALARVLTATQVLGDGEGVFPLAGVLGAAQAGDPGVVFGPALRQAAEGPPPPAVAEAEVAAEAAGARPEAEGPAATGGTAVLAAAVVGRGPASDVMAWAEDLGPPPAPSPAEPGGSDGGRAGEAPRGAFRAQVGWAAGLAAVGAAALARAGKTLARRRRDAAPGSQARPEPEARAGRSNLGAGGAAAAVPAGVAAGRRFRRHLATAAGRRGRRVIT